MGELISFVVAMDKNQLIGQDNDLPWKLPADLAFFKRITMGQPIVMGRKTHESIGRPLPGRENIILTREKNYQANGCTVVHSITELMELKREQLFIIGGAQLFNETFELVDRMYITLIDEEFVGDTYFPEFAESQWQVVSKETGQKDEENPYDYYFMILDRKR